MAKSAKIERTQKLFLKAMKTKFAEDRRQCLPSTCARVLSSPEKSRVHEGRQEGRNGTRHLHVRPKRCHCGGIPLGQRQLTTYEVSTTGVFVEGDDLHFVNNAAMQQMWDDIRRTIIVASTSPTAPYRSASARKSPPRPSTSTSTC